jgi:phosphoesterase RecJ-like protein
VSDYVSTTDLAGVARLVGEADRIALCTHRRPDGDALGSALALARALPRFGKHVDIVLMGPIEPPLLELIGDTPFQRVEDAMPGDDHDLVIVLDTGAWPQLEPLGDWLRARAEKVVVIDHHPVGDEVSPTRIVEPRAAATTQIVLALLDELGFDLAAGIDPHAGGRVGAGSVAEALFVGLATDTGWFRFSNADAAAFAVASRLLALGIDKSALYRLIETVRSAWPSRPGPSRRSSTCATVRWRSSRSRSRTSPRPERPSRT